MQLAERKMHRGWAIVTAVACIGLVLHSAHTLWSWIERGQVFLYDLLHYLSLFYPCLLIVLYSVLAVAFFRQKVDGFFIASLWVYGISLLAENGLWSVVMRDFYWSASDLFDYLIPLALLIGCCARKKQDRPEKGAKIAVTMLLITRFAESLSHLKFSPEYWAVNTEALVLNVFCLLVEGLLFYGAFYAIKTPEEIKETSVMID